MKQSSVIAVLGSLLTLGSGTSITPPKQFLTPYFHLEVFASPNKSLIGTFVTAPDYQAELGLTHNLSEVAVWYQSGPNYTTSQHPLGGPVLVRNVTDAVPDNVPGTPYTARNLIVGTGDCLTCDDAALPRSAALFDKSQEQWDDFGSFQIDFQIEELDPLHQVRFNLTEAGALNGWDKTSYCWFNDGVEERYVVVVTDRYWPEDECSEIHIGWRFVDF